MSRSTHFEQSYFTNFQGGQEFSGSSGAAAKQDGLLYLSETWFSLARCGPCAGVLYNEKLGSYVSCYMADVSGPGDTRLKVWVHAALPDGSGAGTFRDCLQWPFDRFVRNVRLYKMPEAVAVTAERVSCADVIRRYDLADERLAGLMKIVFCSLLTSGQSVKIGLPADNAQPGSLYTEACDVMALICELTPEKKRDRLGFAAGAAVRAAETPFVFCPEGGSDGQIDLASDALNGLLHPEDDLTDIALGEMASLYEKSPDDYAVRMQAVFREHPADLTQMAWAWHLEAVRSGEELEMPQPLLIREIKNAEAFARRDLRAAQLLCRMLSMVQTENASPEFCRTVLDKYIMTAAHLPDRTCREYKESFTGVLRVLRDFCGDKDSIMSDTTRYLKWMRETCPDYFKDFSEDLYAQCENEQDRRMLRQLLAAAGTPEKEEAKPEKRPVKKQPEKTAVQDEAKNASAEKKPEAGPAAGAAGGLAFAGAGFLAGILADQLIAPHAGSLVSIIIGVVFCAFCFCVKFFGSRRR